MPVLDATTLELLPFHRELRDFLRHEDGDVWRWFQDDSANVEQIDAMKFELLKSTYRVDRQTQPAIYRTADEVAAVVGVDAPLTIYQAQNPVGLNASLAYVPGEVHVVLHGPVAGQLNDAELRGLFGHELTHFLLNERGDGEMRIVDRMLSALTLDRAAHPAHVASLRLLLLYNEILCDRGALQACGDLHAAVTLLLKVYTGVQEVSASSFLKQADEIFARGAESTREHDHPEAFIRARALRLWAEQGADANAAVAEMIEGRPGLEALDLLEQRRVASATRRLLDALFVRSWFRTDATLAHARLFFADYAPPDDKPAGSSAVASGDPRGVVRIEPASLGDYFAFVLLDMLAADRDLDEPALALAMTVADEIGVKARFVELARQELKLRKAQLDRVEQNRERLLAEADLEASKR